MKVYELSFQKNIRDIGGMVTKDGRHIKYGRLIRGSVLTKIDENDEQIIKVPSGDYSAVSVPSVSL